MIPYLHVHSHFSFLEGLASPDELVKKAVELGVPALALTDKGNLTGAVDFSDACRVNSLKAIYGLEVQVNVPGELSSFIRAVNTTNTQQPQPKAGSLVLLAEEDCGWSSLCKIASAAQPGESIDIEVLQAYNQGLVCLSGGIRSTAHYLASCAEKDALRNWLGRLADIFPKRFYVELQVFSPQDDKTCLAQVAVAHKLNLPVTATHTVNMLDPTQMNLQHVVSAIRLNQPLTDLPEWAVSPAEAHFISKQAFEMKFATFPNALQTPFEIMERCHGKPPLDQPHYPQLVVQDGQSVEDLLREKAFLGASQLYGSITPDIQQRLEHELGVIRQRGYASLFLIMQEIISFAHQSGIPTASRGSASSSLVAHCLGITTPDPLRHNLYFERFLNPARRTPPDIDTDICSVRREEILHFVIQRFGKEQVAMVATISRLRDRSALREVAKAYGLPPAQISELTEALPWRWFGPRRKEAEDDPFFSLRTRFDQPIHRKILRDAAALINQPDHLSVHPGGMVIAPVPIELLVPTQAAPKGIRITQFDLEAIERFGLVKIDLLGIHGLTVLGEVAAHLAARPENQVSVKTPLELLERIPEEDPLTSETIRQARTIGCFQIESPGMRATLREIHASNVDDILAALALYRPGPLTGGLKDAFVRRHLGLEEPQQLHPALSNLLQDTYGVILYQEQVLRIAHDLAGLSLADADLLRRAMSHFDPGKEMITLRDKFVAGAARVNGVPEAIALKIWEMMAAFAGYGFPKAHAASYAVVSWRAAWCKTHYPDLFITAVLAGGGGYYSQRIYLNEARRMGLKLRPPHVNYARSNFHLVYLEGKPNLFMGMDQVRELTHVTQKRILTERPFSSLADFLARVDPRPVEATNLARCGALEGFGTIPGILAELKAGWQAGQIPLFSLKSNQELDWSLQQKVDAQQEILHAWIDAHPLELLTGKLVGALNTLDAISQVGHQVRVAGMRQTWRRMGGKGDQTAYRMELEDLEGTLVVIVPAEVQRRSHQATSELGPFIIEGRMELLPDDSEPVLVANRIELIK
jgi:DNA polymerase-3 subunit alpha